MLLPVRSLSLSASSDYHTFSANQKINLKWGLCHKLHCFKTQWVFTLLCRLLGSSRGPKLFWGGHAIIVNCNCHNAGRVAVNYKNTVCLYMCWGGAHFTAKQEDTTFSHPHRHTYVYSELWSRCMCKGEKSIDMNGGKDCIAEYD